MLKSNNERLAQINPPEPIPCESGRSPRSPSGSRLFGKTSGPPFVDANPETHSSRRTTTPVRYTGRDRATILVLALDPYNARLYHDMLEVRGYNAVIAEDLDRWFDILACCRPDLLLIDICSADHPSVDVARAITSDPRYQSIPRIAVTDDFVSGDRSAPATIIVNCDGRIPKPVSVLDFYGPIERILKKPRSDRRPCQ